MLTKAQLETLPVHPIVAQTGRLLKGQGAQRALPEAGRREIERALQRLYGEMELALAVQSLFALAAHLFKDGSPAAAKQVMGLAVSTAGEIDRMGAIAKNTIAETRRVKRSRFTRFEGSKGKLRAPQFGGRAALGAQRLTAFHIPAVIR